MAETKDTINSLLKLEGVEKVSPSYCACGEVLMNEYEVVLNGTFDRETIIQIYLGLENLRNQDLFKFAEKRRNESKKT